MKKLFRLKSRWLRPALVALLALVLSSCASHHQPDPQAQHPVCDETQTDKECRKAEELSEDDDMGRLR
ncbi:hypothetical protein EUZ85_06295 [Hahella sp. KA22]|uniref:hypothetical protein n=1 Tax=Hahella sp. KA22 TaxID=1628392 RepID=UPI000FDEB25F|nr:hypothetical protein [Hahella sp. KA22]AZZ90348.1 hypothetical protein ENC22_03740 [Hahella sp. KA22]QAY53719.1 hypothetical protein EUZ85_06295 [Hahella sp. KA22]